MFSLNDVAGYYSQDVTTDLQLLIFASNWLRSTPLETFKIIVKLFLLNYSVFYEY